MACSDDVWARTARGAYHSHQKDHEPAVWCAANGLWRVREAAGGGGVRGYRLERREAHYSCQWRPVERSASREELFALAATVDSREGVAERFPHLRCWYGRDRARPVGDDPPAP